jgi:glutathione S-transferase
VSGDASNHLVIRLYRAPWSTNVERVTLALAYKGLEAESIWIDYGDRRLVEEASGQPLVPVVDFDGEVVHDSPRILQRLDELHPEPPLFPSDRARRAEMDVFIEWFNYVWKRPPNEIERILGLPETDTDQIAQLSELMDDWLGFFEALLDGRDYLFGNELSAADCIAYPFLKYAAGRDPADDDLFHQVLDRYQSADERPRLGAWIERVGLLPGSFRSSRTETA